MADDLTKQLIVQFQATTELMRSQLASAERSVKKFESAAESSSQRVEKSFAKVNFSRAAAGIESATARITRSTGLATNSIRTLAGAVGVLGAGASARLFISLADESNRLTAQLKLATDGFGSFAKANDDVRQIASETRTSLSATANLYATFARGANELGVNQDQVSRITQTVNEAFKVSGATSAEASQSIRQLSQAFASGVLRGDEFNSMMEGAPRLAKLLADSMGVTVGSLRAMAEAGELTADKLVAAFSDKQFTEGLDAEFRQLPVTFDEAITKVHDAAVITFGAFDRGGQFSQAIANFAMDGSANFAQLERDAEHLGLEIRATFEGLSDAFDPLVSGAISAFGLIDGHAADLASRVRPLLGEIDAISGWIGKQGLGGRLLTGGSVSDWWNDKPTRGTTLLNDFNAGYDRTIGERALARVWAGDPLADIGGTVRNSGARPTASSAGSAAKPKRAKSRGGGSRSRRAAAPPKDPNDALFRDGSEPGSFRFAQRSEDSIYQAVEDVRKRIDAQNDNDFEATVDLVNRKLDYEFDERQAMQDRLRQTEERQIGFLAGMFESAFHGGTKAIWRDFKDMGLAVIAQLLAKFAMAKLGGKGFNLGEAFGASVSSILGFADGGRPPIGRVSMVGERGPELFVPDVAGTIVPNHMMGSGSGVSVVINAPGATAETVAMIRREIAGAAPAIVSAATNNTARQMGRRRLG